MMPPVDQSFRTVVRGKFWVPAGFKFITNLHTDGLDGISSSQKAERSARNKCLVADDSVSLETCLLKDKAIG